LPETAVAFLEEGNKSIWLTVWSLEPNVTMFSLCWLVIWVSRNRKRFKFFRPCWLKKECILAIDQFFYLFLAWIFKLSILLYLKFFRMPFINSTSSAIPGHNPNWWDNLCLTKICGRLIDWLRLTKESSRLQPCLRRRSVGCFPEQRLVIEPRHLTLCATPYG